jgi:ADP-ribosyl-[dinitrogen reductase] hydrolase
MTSAEEARKDRAVGALLGLAVGDAVGTTLEFERRDRHPPLTDMVGGGPFRLKPGEWTDDTSMALCLAESLLACRGLDEADLMRRFVDWWQDGHNSHNGMCFDIGITTANALNQFRRTGNPLAGSSDRRAAGNGSLMRLSPVSIRWHRSKEHAIAAARKQSITTHGAAEAVDACAYYAELIVDAIAGGDAASALSPRPFTGEPAIEDIARCGWRGKRRDQISSSGYVVHTLEAALWSIGQNDSFEAAILTAANLADDADSVAAVTGQLAGAIWGASAIPQHWTAKLAWHDKIRGLADALYQLDMPGN